jgi:hypothetical protein
VFSPKFKWIGSRRNRCDSPAQALQTASKGVRPQRALRRLAKLEVVKRVPRCSQLPVNFIVAASYSRFLEDPVHSFDLTIGLRMVAWQGVRSVLATDAVKFVRTPMGGQSGDVWNADPID